MTPGRLLWVAAVVVTGAVVVRHHRDYLRGRRPLSFGAFLETAGWIVLALVAVAGAAGGAAHPATRTVEIAAAVVGLLLVAVGGQLR
ncbi:MAG: hypothetical protein QN173_04450 [Armatimonadota bacterium]|nr:hypothetical protein [Armatimonadota bacterium]MDR7400906.1 hypothetical protein [Armatimonadota bacterium]MDR7404193.1 hypothetical protein [Armatimonadota bacterium]MDR7437376.1 hypothetical protein [Armatimonadota bacterium]MDR7472808.1 hypothetical protein [Armatimonadota bacterium]